MPTQTLMHTWNGSSLILSLTSYYSLLQPFQLVRTRLKIPSMRPYAHITDTLPSLFSSNTSPIYDSPLPPACLISNFYPPPPLFHCKVVCSYKQNSTPRMKAPWVFNPRDETFLKWGD